jgi:hypothetical protein
MDILKMGPVFICADSSGSHFQLLLMLQCHTYIAELFISAAVCSHAEFAYVKNDEQQMFCDKYGSFYV